jgi:hypothetical protein
MRRKEERKKCHRCHEKIKEEKSARKRIGRGPGRWLELPLSLAGADADEVADGEVDEIGVIDVENPETEDVTEGVGKGLELEWESDVDSVPTVMVLVPDEVDRFSIDWGMEIDDVAAGNGELNDPDIPRSLKEVQHRLAYIKETQTGRMLKIHGKVYLRWH